MLSNNNKTNSIRDYNLDTNANANANDNTVSLAQGDRFLNYQNKIKKQTAGSNKGRLFSNNKEGFSANLREDTDITLNQTNFTSDDNSTLRNLKLEYAATAKIYQKLQAKFKEQTHQFFKRIDPTKNKFLGKNIRFRGGEVCYVTMRGVARFYTDSNVADNTAGKNGCPAKADAIPVKIPWSWKYAQPGETIPTSPPLVAGPPMTYAQACGNEGSNVYVNTSVSSKPKYVGAYVNNNSSGITYIGPRPPEIIPVQNPNFSTPALQNDSYTIMTSSMPGWSGNAQIVNNSSAWGFPIPYPGGGQCLTIQGTAVFSQTFSNLDVGTYTLSFQACGRPRYGSVLVNLNLNGVTFYTVNIGDTFVWTPLSVNFTVSQAGANTLAFQAMNPAGNTGDNSTAFTAISLVFGAGDTDPPTYTYDMCKTQAITQGYQYFGLTHAEDDKGFCVATKDYVAATGTGTSYKTVSLIPKWSSETNGKGGAYAKLTSLGTLQVYDSNNQSIYSTPAPSGPGSDSFWGCYQDLASTGAARSVPDFVQGGDTSINDCRGLANQSANSIYAVQYAINNNGDNGQCFINNSNPTDFLSSFNAGPATNCTKNSAGWTIGQGWSNAVYGTQPGFGCFIILQDNGALAIYRGQGGSDNQGIIWSAGSDSSSFTSNPHWKPSNGKYGTYWASNGFNGQTGSDDGFILYPGQCMFSNDGKLQLIMQSDGNLVLYTSTIAVNERTDSKGNKVSDQDGYALYEFEDTPNTGYTGTLGYVDGAGTFHKYADGKATLVDDDYTKYSSLQQMGYQYSINGEQYSQKSLADCKKTCTDDPGCGGITYDTQSGTCYYNDSDVSLYDTGANEYFETYMKNKKPANPFFSEQIHNISGSMRDKYPIGKDMPTGDNLKGYIPDGPDDTVEGFTQSSAPANQFNLHAATAVVSAELSHTEDKLNQLADEISKYNAEFAEYNNKVLKQSKENRKITDKYLNEYGVTTNQIKHEKKAGTNIDAILDDSNIVVLQENYNYAMWSILAVGIGIGSMILVKK